jgi:PAS domain S-box-containing protein
MTEVLATPSELAAMIETLQTRIERLNATIADQQGTINSLIVLAEQKLSTMGEDSAFDGWKRTLLLNRELQRRNREVGEAERLLRSVVDSLDSRMCILGEDGVIVGVNRLWTSFATDLGWSAEESREGGDFLGLLSRLGEELAEPVGAALRLALGGQLNEQSIKGPLQVAGRAEHVVVRIHPIRDHDVAKLVISIVDITEAHHTQQELNRLTEESRLLALVAQHTDHGVVISDLDGRIEWVNESFCRGSGYTREEAIGQLRMDLLNVPAGPTEQMRTFRKRLAEGLPAEVELPSLTKDGRQRWLHIQVKTLLNAGAKTRRVGIELDITQQREAEAALMAANRRAQTLVEALEIEKTLLSDVLASIPQLVYWKDEELRYAGVNQAFLRLRGLDPHIVIGHYEAELGTDDELSTALKETEPRVLATGERVENQRVVLAGTDGPPHALLLSVLPQVDAEGRVIGVIGVAADITHVSTLEQQLAQATRLESIGQLAAGIAHEINTPVQFVADNTRFLAESFTGVMAALTAAHGGTATLDAALDEQDLDLEFLAEEIPNALSQSQEGLARVAQIVRAMKDFSHPGQGKAESDVNRAIESTTQVCRNEWRYVADLTLDLDPDVGLVPCYEGELKQVLLNIVVNAAQAIAEHQAASGNPAQGRIEVRSQRLPDRVRITIRDDGPGMPPEVQRRIFDPFFTTKAVGKGTGQGLSMAYASIVNKHGGNLTVDSAPRAGTTFTLELPAASVDPAESKD